MPFTGTGETTCRWILPAQCRRIGVTQKIELSKHDGPDAQPEPTGTRLVWFDGATKAREVPVYARADCGPGTTLTGPAVIDQFDSTTLIPLRASAEVDAWRNVNITVPKE